MAGPTAYVFIDEQLPDSDSGLFVFGVLFVTEHVLSDISKELIRLSGECPHEIKFEQVRSIPAFGLDLDKKKLRMPNKAVAQVAADWIGYILQRSKFKGFRFVCYMVRTRHPDYQRGWYGKKKWVQYNKHLNTAISRLRYSVKKYRATHLKIFIDARTQEKNDNLLAYLKETIPRKFKLPQNAVEITPVSSENGKHARLIQLTDLLLGAISYPNKVAESKKKAPETKATQAKTILAKKFQKRLRGFSKPVFPKDHPRDERQRRLEESVQSLNSS